MLTQVESIKTVETIKKQNKKVKGGANNGK